MTDHQLTDLLERSADRIDVGPPPTSAMVAGAGRSRRRRAALVVLSAAAAVAVVAAGAAVLDDLPSSPSPSVNVMVGQRLVGIGHLAIAVPEEWGTNEATCGTPVADTVVIDVGGIDGCLAARPRGVESISIETSPPPVQVLANATPVTVDGLEATRTATECGEISGGVRTCSAALHFPTEGVSFLAQSSTSADTVDDLLAEVRVVPSLVGVPGYQVVNSAQQEQAAATYVGAVEDADLRVDLREVMSSGPGGFVELTSPAPGEMVEPGSTVTVFVSR